MAKKPFNLKDFKDSIQVSKVELKKDKYVELDPCLQDVLKLPGIPLGHITQVYGKSDTGKTSLMFHTAVQAQKQGIVPVIIITEGKVDWSRATAMGLNLDNCIIEENLKYLEDIFDFIDNKIIGNVMDGTLPHDAIILWDSMGNTNSEKSMIINPKTGKRETKNIHMQAAAIKSERLTILMDRVNDTRKVVYPKSVGVFIINSVYSGTAAYSGAPTPEIVKGGQKVRYTASLMIKCALVSKLEAQANGRKMKFGMVSKISVQKNHINGQEYSGEFVITPDAILPSDSKSVKDYKELNKEKWGDMEIFELPEPNETGEE